MILKRRPLAAVVVALAFTGWGATPSIAQSLVERANRGLVEIATSSTLLTDARMAEDLGNLLDDGQTRRVIGMIGKGSVQDLADVKILRGVDVAIVQSDVLDRGRAQHLPPGIETIWYIAKLYNAELHLLARANVKSVADLAGKRVNFGLPGDGTGVTAERVFDVLKIHVDVTNYDPAAALDKLRSGEIAALAEVTAKPAPLFQIVRPQEGLHLLAIPLRPELASTYIPARFSTDDYPNLVSGQDRVDTIAVGEVLVAANLAPDSERYRNIANFVDALFTQFPKLQEGSFHPKWSEVNLAAELPNMRRFPAADQWIRRNGGPAQPQTMSEQQMRDVFAKFLDERAKAGGGGAMTPQQKADLFDQFKQWQEGKTR
jgi:TRAP-type uncharacterized transport system substrate-binding protein